MQRKTEILYDNTNYQEKTEFASNLKTKEVNVCSGKNVKVSLLN